MGQHKYNPTAIKAKNGELIPKEKAPGKRETERWLYARCKEVLFGRLYSHIYEKYK